MKFEGVVADGGLALAFDGVGGALGRATLSLIRDGGRFSIHGASSGNVTSDFAGEVLKRRIEVIPIEQLFEFPQYQKAWLETVLEDVAAKRLAPLIGQTFPIERVADAHARLETRDTIGKTLLLMTPERRSADQSG